MKTKTNHIPRGQTQSAKYQPYPQVPMLNRDWPNQVIDHAPIWCSVDLRDGNQALINPMNLEKKVKMFQMLVDIGFKEIEVGFPSASQMEFDFVRLLIEQNQIPDDVTPQVLVPCREELIQKTFDSLKGIKKVIVHLYNSTSVAQREIVFRMSKSEIIEIAVNGAQCLKKQAEAIPETHITFQYSPESFTGTELDFSKEICEAVMDVWQPTPEKKCIVNFPATVEMATPNVYADQIEWLHKNIKYRDSMIFSLHPHNDRGTGVAATELGIMAGADRVEGTLFGNGERTGNVDLVTMGLNLFSQGVDPQLDFSNLNQIKEIAEYCTEIPVHPRHPYVGELVYTAFSGTHQDAIKKGIQAWKDLQRTCWDVPYLPIDPLDVGRNYEAIIRINSQSGKGGIAYIMEQEFGFQLPKKMYPEFGAVVQEYADQVKREVLSTEVLQCFEEEYLNQTGLTLNEFFSQPYSENDSDRVSISASVDHNQEQITIEGIGNGPIDAFVQGMRKCFSIDFQILSYEEHALETGSHAQAAAYIEIEDEDHEKYWGVGVDSNIVMASTKALISALNRDPNLNTKFDRHERGGMENAELAPMNTYP